MAIVKKFYKNQGACGKGVRVFDKSEKPTRNLA